MPKSLFCFHVVSQTKNFVKVSAYWRDVIMLQFWHARRVSHWHLNKHIYCKFYWPFSFCHSFNTLDRQSWVPIIHKLFILNAKTSSVIKSDMGRPMSVITCCHTDIFTNVQPFDNLSVKNRMSKSLWGAACRRWRHVPKVWRQFI